MQNPDASNNVRIEDVTARDSEIENDLEWMICPCCHQHNAPHANFCVACGAPISATAAIAPFERIFAEGFLLREAAFGKHTKLFTVIAVWLIFFPMMVSVIGLFILVPRLYWLDPGLLVGDIAMLFMLTWIALLLYRVTQNYIGQNQSPPDSPPPSD
ncbi:hypothetical protein M2103_002052 [Ereboglobus sp. PH5-5]|uniref:zinc ribbon domain-containing protein n=1 Tax=Ereboglobus sp. PH5-5 TaxID=2940529 RepID=UPI00240648E8|nr:zinc ribbon domain-containing protein [Ereboglobus sp. PH5-5]MDF9833819.1 hypothetical protein [Ereboglobus sp. PH5-5]